MPVLNLLPHVKLEKKDYHIIFEYYSGGYETSPRHIDYTGTDVDCPDGTITAEDKKKIFEYLHEHYGYPPFNKKDVENKLKEYNGIHL